MTSLPNQLLTSLFDSSKEKEKKIFISWSVKKTPSIGLILMNKYHNININALNDFNCGGG